jgi:ABC-type transporter Mla subunit MlaD
MSDKIPDEREITKQQLWKRIEASAQGVSSTVQGFQSQIDEVLSNVKDSVEQALRKERKTNEEIRAAFISEIKKTKNELIQYSDKLNENLQESMSTAKLDVDKRLREFKAQLETSFDTRLENMLTQLNENIVTVSNKIDL